MHSTKSIKLKFLSLEINFENISRIISIDCKNKGTGKCPFHIAIIIFVLLRNRGFIFSTEMLAFRNIFNVKDSLLLNCECVPQRSDDFVFE